MLHAAADCATKISELCQLVGHRQVVCTLSQQALPTYRSSTVQLHTWALLGSEPEQNQQTHVKQRFCSTQRNVRLRKRSLSLPGPTIASLVVSKRFRSIVSSLPNPFQRCFHKEFPAGLREPSSGFWVKLHSSLMEFDQDTLEQMVSRRSLTAPFEKQSPMYLVSLPTVCKNCKWRCVCRDIVVLFIASP